MWTFDQPLEFVHARECFDYSMETIFLDESGYTGEHLLDASQPVFALASIHLNEAACAELKARFFGRVQATELKYSQLRRRTSNQRLVLDFIEHVTVHHREDIKVYVAEKRYALTAKVVDILVEKAEHALGGNVYERNPEKAATVMFQLLSARGGAEFFQRFLMLFADFVRDPTPATYEAFFGFVRPPHPDRFVDQLFDFLRAPELMFGTTLISRDALGSLDLAIGMAFALANWWQMDLHAPLRLVHDQSSNMAGQRAIWDPIVDPAVAPAIVGVGSRVAAFPINVHETEFARSEAWAGLQLADILAGASAAATAVFCGLGTPQAFERELADPILRVVSGAIVPVPPGYEHPAGTMSAESTDLPTHMAEILSKRSS